MGEMARANDTSRQLGTRENEVSAELSPAALRAALNTVMAASLRPVSAVLSVLYAVFSVSHTLVLPPPVAAPMTFVAAVTAATFLGLYFVLGWRPAPSAWAHPLGAGIAAVVLLNCLLLLAFLSEPLQTTNVMLFLVGVGSLFLSTPWFALVTGVTLLAWGGVEWGATPSPAWRHFGFGLLSATALAVVVHIVRVRTFQRLVQLRFQDEQRQRELQEAMHIVQQSEQRYRSLVETANDMIFTLSPDDTIVSLNPAFAAMTGWLRADWEGSPFAMLLHPADVPIARECFHRILQGESPPRFVARVRAKEGTYRVGEFTISPQRRGSEVVGIFGIARDITERQQAEEAVQAARDELEARVHERTGELVAANAALRAEIADRRRAEHALRESEEQYRDLVENINDIIYTQDEQGYITYISPVVEPLGGYHPTEIIGHSFTEFIHPDDLPALLESAQRTLAGQLEPSEFRVKTKTGAVRWARSSSRPIMRQEHAIGLRGVITDITARKRAENHAQALLAVAEDISGTFDLQQLLERVQRRTAEVLPCEIVATFYWDPQRSTFRLISQHGLPASLLPDAEALAFPPNEPFGGRVASGQTVVMNEIPAQSGVLMDVLSHFRITALVATPLRVYGRHLGALVACTTTSGYQFDGNQVELCNGIARQVAVGIEATELYKQQQEEAEVAAVVARVGQEMIASLNTPMVFEQLCRLTAEALAGSRSCLVLWQPEHAIYTIPAHWGFSEEHQATLKALTLPEKAVVDLVTLLQADEVAGIHSPVPPELIPQDLLERCQLEKAIFLRLQHGREFLGFQVCDAQEQRENTARRSRIARGLAQTAALVFVNAKLLEELERANRIKEEFVGTMSHELRTPLSVIIGYTQLMAEETFGSLTAEQADVLGRISKNTKELLDLINATLDLSRLQNQQRLSLTVQDIKGAVLLAELESEMHQLSRKPGVRLQWQIAPTLPVLYTDVVKLKMVLKNVITNALKFTDTGVITVTARPQQSGVEFRITDTGIGIPREALATIFEPFRQVDSSSTRRHGGVGLGLYIVHQLVELLGGSVTVESEIGSGSTFRVWIPADKQAEKGPQTANQV